MPSEPKLLLPVRIIAGDYELVSSGVVSFAPEKGFRAEIGPLKIEFVFQIAESGQPEIVRKAIPESLTFQYIIKGRLPNAPAGIGLKLPDTIGASQEATIHFSFGLSALGDDQKAISLNYAVYMSKPSVQTSSKSAEASNG